MTRWRRHTRRHRAQRGLNLVATLWRDVTKTAGVWRCIFPESVGKRGRRPGWRNVGCFQSSEGFSQAIREERPRLILLLFGGIPNSPEVVLKRC